MNLFYSGRIPILGPVAVVPRRTSCAARERLSIWDNEQSRRWATARTSRVFFLLPAAKMTINEHYIKVTRDGRLLRETPAERIELYYLGLQGLGEACMGTTVEGQRKRDTSEG